MQGIGTAGRTFALDAGGTVLGFGGEPGPGGPQRLGVRLLGPIELSVGGRAVDGGGTKQRTLLAALLLARGGGLSNRRLEELLWGDEPPETSHAQIHTYIYKIRKLMGSAGSLVRQGAGYALLPGPRLTVDLAEFEGRTGAAKGAQAAGQDAQAAAQLREALALWRGPALANATEDLRRVEQPRLEELRLAALEDRIEADLTLGRQRELVPELTGLVARHPLRERLRGQLMTALHRCGRQADALGVYQCGLRLLRERSGLYPGEPLRRLHALILADAPSRTTSAGDAGGERAAAGRAEGSSAAFSSAARAEPAGVAGAGPAVAAGPGEPGGALVPHGSSPAADHASRGRPAQLPPQQLEPACRDAELARVLSSLRHGPAGAATGPVPVCVITGMAGVGKTLLAVHAARALRGAFPDGQLYADLRGADGHPREVAAVLGGFLPALGVDAAALPAGLAERVSLYRSLVADRRILVLLDDADSAAAVRPLLPSGGACGALVTCRTRLSSVEGAVVVDLEPLPVGPAVQLLARFIGRERVEAEPGAARAIAEHCGGLPLAVGIAGARLAARRHWSLARLAARLASAAGLLDELSLEDKAVRASLTRGTAALPAAVIEAWYAAAALELPWFGAWAVSALLGVDADAAEEIIDHLVDARLLQALAATRRCGQVRYRFHPLLLAVAREHAAERIPAAERRAALGQVLSTLLALAREAEARLSGGPAGRGRRLSPDLPTEQLLADPAAWFADERAVLEAAARQARAENRRVLASELAQAVGRLDLAVSGHVRSPLPR